MSAARDPVLGYLGRWEGGLATAQLAFDGVPTRVTFRGELLRDTVGDTEPPPDLPDWFLVVRSDDMRVPGVGTVDLFLERYAERRVEEREVGPATLVFTVPGRVVLRLEPVVEDPG